MATATSIPKDFKPRETPKSIFKTVFNRKTDFTLFDDFKVEVKFPKFVAREFVAARKARLEKQGKPTTDLPPLDFVINPKGIVSPNWHRSSNKLMVIFAQANFRDTADKHGCRMLAHPESHTLYHNILNLAGQQSQQIDKTCGMPELLVTHYECCQSLDLTKTGRKAAKTINNERIVKIIAKYKPNKVLIMGDFGAEDLLDDQVLSVKYQRGNKHLVDWSKVAPELNLKNKDKKDLVLPVWSTINCDKAIPIVKSSGSLDLDDDVVLHANAIGYVSRCIRNCILGYNPFSLEYMTLRGQKDDHVKVELVDTLSKFKKMMKYLRKAWPTEKAMSIDIESNNLLTKNNQILSIQLACTTDKAYFIPVYHQNTPWLDVDIETVIKPEIRSLMDEKVDYWYDPNICKGVKGFSSPSKDKVTTSRYLLGQNIGFDIRVLTHWLDIKYLYMPVFDTQGGGFLLDENLKALTKHGTKPNALNTIFARYENMFYETNAFGKKDRTAFNSADISKSSSPAVMYGAMDATACIGIAKMQMQESKLQDFEGESYYPYYMRFALNQLSTLIKVQARMMRRGVKFDINYTLHEMDKTTSKILKLLDDRVTAFYKLDTVKEANELLNKKGNWPKGSLWAKRGAKKESIMIFDHTKKAHLDVLFFEVLKLDPVNISRKTGDRSLDKEFKKEYCQYDKETNEPLNEVALYKDITELKQLKGTFIDSLYNKYNDNMDSVSDGRLRPGFGYLPVVSGRTNSFKPSLQNIPNHGRFAKAAKRQFISPPGMLLIDLDFSSWEVNCAGMVSEDKNMGKTYKTIHNIRTNYRHNPSDENYTMLNTAGDAHKMSFSRFTGMPIQEWVTLSLTPEGQLIAKDKRQTSKALGFGLIYGKTLKSMAKDLDKEVDETEEIMNGYFLQFYNLEDWLKWSRDSTSNRMYTYSPIGRKRNMPGVLSPDEAVKAAMARRAQNSPIQGIASDFMVIAADLMARYQTELYEFLLSKGHYKKEIERCFELPLGPNVLIHDSGKGEAPFNLVLLHTHIQEFCMTRGIEDYYKEVFNYEFTNHPGVDIDYGSTWSDIQGWDMNPLALAKVLSEALANHNITHANSEYVVQDIPATVEAMGASYAHQSKVLDLNNKFPLNFEYYADSELT